MIVTQEKQSDNSSSGARSTNRNIPNIPNLSFKIVDLLKDPESHMDPMALWSNIPTPRDPPGLSFNGSNIAVDVATEGAGSAGRLGVSGSSDPNWSAMKPANALASVMGTSSMGRFIVIDHD